MAAKFEDIQGEIIKADSVTDVTVFWSWGDI